MSLLTKAMKELTKIDNYDVIGKAYRIKRYYVVRRWDSTYHIYDEKSPLTIITKDDLIKILMDQFCEEEMEKLLE